MYVVVKIFIKNNFRFHSNKKYNYSAELRLHKKLITKNNIMVKKFLLKLLVVCSLIAFCVSCTSTSSNQVDLKLIPVKSGEKWGYINKKGEYVINPQFQQ